VREPRSPVTPTDLHNAEKEKRLIALRRLALSPCAAKDLAPLLPPTVGAKSKDPARRRREVAGALFRALEEEGLVKGPDAEGFFWKVRS
jgi:hypothetical protein